MILDETNITDTFVDCDTCTALCYKLIDCQGVGSHPTVSTVDSTFAVYVGKTIKWTDAADAPAIERCATVSSYVCRAESYPTPVITVVDCYGTCAECEFVEPEPTAPELKTGRSIKPGYNVPDCVTPSTTSCE